MVAYADAFTALLASPFGVKIDRDLMRGVVSPLFALEEERTK
jgi:hypothetical protein